MQVIVNNIINGFVYEFLLFTLNFSRLPQMKLSKNAGNVTLWGPVQVETIHCEDHCMVGTLMSECYSIEVAILTLWGPLQVSIIHCQYIMYVLICQ